MPRRFIKAMENKHKQAVFETVLLGDSLTPGADGSLEPSAEYTLFIARAPSDNPNDIRMTDYFEERQLKTGQVIVTANWLANAASPAIRRLMNTALMKEIKSMIRNDVIDTVTTTTPRGANIVGSRVILSLKVDSVDTVLKR